jgi:Flp pilus assembly protein TadD
MTNNATTNGENTMRALLKSTLPLMLVTVLAACSGGADRVAGGGTSAQMGRAALAGGAPAIALQVGAGMLKDHPQDPEALALQADALSALGRSAEAVPVYRALLVLDPNAINAHIGLGRVLMGTDAAAAEHEFLAVLAKAPNTPIAANNLGIARDLQGRHAEAQVAYRSALGMAPSMQAASVNLALSLSVSGRAAEAIPLLRPLAEAPSADTKTRQDLAVALAMAGDRAAAARLLGRDMSPAEVEVALRQFVALAKY